MPLRQVFLSSTGADLRTYREAANAVLHKLDGWHCIRMENFGAQTCDVNTFCQTEANKCDLFIGIIGLRFGDGPEGTKRSFTQCEYDAAVEAKLPRLLFLTPEDFPVAGNLREPERKLDAQDAFRKAIRDEKRILSIGFTSPHELTTQIVTAIRNWERESSGTHAADPTRYLQALWEDTRFIAIRRLRVGNESAHQFHIDQLYTPLTPVLAGAERKDGQDDRKPVPLQQALENPRVVLVGAPGAGKSTFLRRIAFAASSGRITPREGRGNQPPLECIRRAPQRRAFGTLPEASSGGRPIGWRITPRVPPKVRKARGRGNLRRFAGAPGTPVRSRCAFRSAASTTQQPGTIT